MKTLAILSMYVLINVMMPSFAQTQTTKFDIPNMLSRNLGGPRLGFTYVPSSNSIGRELKAKNISNLLSQFGWHFEYQVVPEGGGPQFLVEFVPLVAGVESGTLIPSASLALGIRFPEGYEFGMGPNLMIGGDKGAMTSLLIAVGRTFNYGGVNIPLNLVFATNPSGNRYSIIVGYAIAK